MSKKSRNCQIRRRSLVELMEMRLPLAVDLGHNFLMPGDVNNDGLVRASDALAIINVLAQRGEAPEVDHGSIDAGITELFYDVNDDGHTTAGDAIRVVNQLGRQVESNDVVEYFQGDDSVQARIELELKGNGRAEFELRLVGASPSQSFQVVVGGEVLGQIETDERGRGRLELKYGGDGPELPDVLATADAATPIAIGDVVSGTLGSLGGTDASDGGSDGQSDGASDGQSDGLSDASSDSTTDGGSDVPVPLSASPSNDSSASSSVSDGASDGDVDGSADGQSDAFSDANSDSTTDGGSDVPVPSSASPSNDSSASSSVSDGASDVDGSSDGQSDALSDAQSDAQSDGGSDGESDHDSESRGQAT